MDEIANGLPGSCIPVAGLPPTPVGAVNVEPVALRNCPTLFDVLR